MTKTTLILELTKEIEVNISLPVITVFMLHDWKIIK